jgi:hypothetical protein
MQELIIDRSKWRTGGSNFNYRFGGTELLNDKGMMCCLGFYCLQIGNKSKQEIFEIALPETLGDYTGIEPLVKGSGYNSEFTEDAVSINDAESLLNEFREIQIHQHFKIINIDVKFINEYPS